MAPFYGNYYQDSSKYWTDTEWNPVYYGNSDQDNVARGDSKPESNQDRPTIPLSIDSRSNVLLQERKGAISMQSKIYREDKRSRFINANGQRIRI